MTFTLPPSGGGGGGAVTLSPNFITMLVGGTATIQALNSSGQPVTGLTWTSSDPTVVSLSTDDPPLLTALPRGTRHHHGRDGLGQCHRLLRRSELSRHPAPGHGALVRSR